MRTALPNVFLYSHTHWDREWYQPFEVFRLHLTEVVKRVVEDLEQKRLSKFFLDGQSIVLDDVIALEPDLAPRISRLMEQGELAAGPWYVLPDQMLVSGESLIRNLHMGLKAVSKFGAPSLTGYCPDTFGHTHDLPRILKGFGISNAFVWRGVPELGYGPLFWWESPDGSRVLTWHFSRGYYQTIFHEGEDDVASRAVRIREMLAPLVSESGPEDGTATVYCRQLKASLFPCGADHTAPPSNFNALLQELNNGEFEVVPTQLADFAATLTEKVTSAPTLVGLLNRELRDNRASKNYCNAYLLPGVLSTRLYLKRENRESEYRLARFAEPLFTMLHVRNLMSYPKTALNRCWELLLRNHPHDSICGCSVDAVHDEMQSRTSKLKQMLSTLEDRARGLLSGLSVDSLISPDDPDREIANVLVANPGATAAGSPIPFTFFAPAGSKIKSADHIQLRNKTTSEELFSGWGRIPYYKDAVKYEGWFWADELAPFGVKSFDWQALLSARVDTKDRSPQLVQVRSHSLDNGTYRVSVSDSGEINVLCREADKSIRNFSLEHRFKDTGDAGDTYNYDPIEGDKPVTAKLKSVEPGEKGPLVGSLKLTYEIKIPECAVETKPASASNAGTYKRASKLISHIIETEITLKRGGRLVHFHTKFDNQANDHRLEVHLDTGEPIKSSWSENHFSLVKRLHTASPEKLPVAKGCESLPDRFPTQRFVLANGQIFLNDGLPEYGTDGRALTITLLRSVGILSRGVMRTRGGGAGPHLPTPGAQCIGPNGASYAWAPLPSDSWKKKELFDRLPPQVSVEAFGLAEEFENQYLSAFVSKEALSSIDVDSLAESMVTVSNPAIKIVSLHMNQSKVILRLLNVTEHMQRTDVTARFPVKSMQICRLDETPLEDVTPVIPVQPGETALQQDFERYQMHTVVFNTVGDQTPLSEKVADAERPPEKPKRKAAKKPPRTKST